MSNLDTSSMHDFLLRGLAFTVVCLATRSPDLFHMAHTSKMVFWRECHNDLDCGLVRHNKEYRKFITRFLGPLHKESKTPGSAPGLREYWLLGAPVCLRRDIVTREAFQDAIINAISKNRYGIPRDGF